MGIILENKVIKNCCYQKMEITKNVLLKKLRNIQMIFDVEKLTLRVKFGHFLTPPCNTNSQNSIISFGYVDF